MKKKKLDVRVGRSISESQKSMSITILMSRNEVKIQTL